MASESLQFSTVWLNDLLAVARALQKAGLPSPVCASTSSEDVPVNKKRSII